MASRAPEMGLTDILQELADRPDGDQLSLPDLVDCMQGRGFGPLLLVPSLIVLLPTGAIPGVPILGALLIILVAGQIVAGKRTPWVPRRLRQARIDRKRFQRMVARLTPWTRRFDRLLQPRLQWLTTDPVDRIGGLLCILLAISMLFLQLIPFAVAPPALVIVLYALSLSAHDGALALVALTIMVAAAVAAVLHWPLI